MAKNAPGTATAAGAVAWKRQTKCSHAVTRPAIVAIAYRQVKRLPLGNKGFNADNITGCNSSQKCGVENSDVFCGGVKDLCTGKCACS